MRSVVRDLLREMKVARFLELLRRCWTCPKFALDTEASDRHADERTLELPMVEYYAIRDSLWDTHIVVTATMLIEREKREECAPSRHRSL